LGKQQDTQAHMQPEHVYLLLLIVFSLYVLYHVKQSAHEDEGDNAEVKAFVGSVGSFKTSMTDAVICILTATDTVLSMCAQP
jgi:hypothetical protein